MIALNAPIRSRAKSQQMGLKAADQMEWVRRMNSIQARAEEIVLNELIYLEEAPDADT